MFLSAKPNLKPFNIICSTTKTKPTLFSTKTELNQFYTRGVQPSSHPWVVGFFSIGAKGKEGTSQAREHMSW
jgi:hypothetical protein